MADYSFINCGLLDFAACNIAGFYDIRIRVLLYEQTKNSMTCLNALVTFIDCIAVEVLLSNVLLLQVKQEGPRF